MIPKPKTNHNWVDISCEKERTYEFLLPNPGYDENEKGWVATTSIWIISPQWLAISESGGHRIVDARGNGHYIPGGWVHLHWIPKEGMETFVC